MDESFRVILNDPLLSSAHSLTMIGTWAESLRVSDTMITVVGAKMREPIPFSERAYDPEIVFPNEG